MSSEFFLPFGEMAKKTLKTSSVVFLILHVSTKVRYLAATSAPHFATESSEVFHEIREWWNTTEKECYFELSPNKNIHRGCY